MSQIRFRKAFQTANSIKAAQPISACNCSSCVEISDWEVDSSGAFMGSTKLPAKIRAIKNNGNLKCGLRFKTHSFLPGLSDSRKPAVC